MKRLLFFGGHSIVVLLLAGMSTLGIAQVQAFPSKVVKIVVPYTPGAVTDVAARSVGQRLSEIWGQPVIVENRAGAGTTIGAEYVAKSAPDGYTLLFSDHPTYVITPHLYSKLNYNTLTDLAPVTVVFRSTPVFAISNAVPAKDFREFLAYIKANPGKIVYGSFGNGSYPHLVIEQLKQMARLDMVHVPYKGGAPALADLMAGRVGLMMASYPLFAQHAKAGKLKVIAVSGEKRLSVLPDIPTVSESGVPGYTVVAWFAMMAPAGTQTPVLEKIRAGVVEVLQDHRPDSFTEKFLKPQGMEPGGDSREDVAAMVKTEHARSGNLVKSLGIKLD